MGSSTVTQFRHLVSKLQQASDPEIKKALARIAAETRERAANSSPHSADFFETLWPALLQLKGSAHADVRIECLLDCAKYFYFAGDVAKGVGAARDAISLAVVVGNDELAMKGYCYLGNTLADLGAVAEGIEAHVAALDLCQDRNLERRAIALVNLGVALLYAGEYHDAIGCFEVAESLAEYSPSLGAAILSNSLSNRALCYLRLNRLDDGLLVAKRAVAQDSELMSGAQVLDALIAECHYAQLLLEAGNFAAASRRLDTIRALAMRSGSQKARVMAGVIEGLIEIQNGDSARGLERLESAREIAGEVNSLVQDALVGLVKGNELLGRSGKALECLQQLMRRVGSERQKCTLLYLRSVPELRTYGSFRANDLTALQHREAILRAKVAESRLADTQIEMLERLAVTADLREEASGEHGYRVGRLSKELAEDLGMDDETCHAIDLAARLHDIGKMGVPEQILLTSEELKEAERNLMRKHTTFGAELLAKSNIEKLRLAEEIALHHHEWWDGSGYPGKRAGKRIPIHARIVALADMFDALTHGRPYAEPWDMDRAIDEIGKRKGTQFDPELTDRFIALVAKLRKKHPHLDEYLSVAARKSPFLQARRKIKLMLEQERRHDRGDAFPGNETRH